MSKTVDDDAKSEDRDVPGPDDPPSDGRHEENGGTGGQSPPKPRDEHRRAVARRPVHPCEPDRDEDDHGETGKQLAFRSPERIEEPPDAEYFGGSKEPCHIRAEGSDLLERSLEAEAVVHLLISPQDRRERQDADDPRPPDSG